MLCTLAGSHGSRLGTKNNAGQVPAAALLCAMGVARDQLPKLPHIRDDARFVCSPPVRRSSRLVRLLHMDAWMRLTQRGNGFVGDVGAGGEVNLGKVGSKQHCRHHQNC